MTLRISIVLAALAAAAVGGGVQGVSLGHEARDLAVCDDSIPVATDLVKLENRQPVLNNELFIMPLSSLYQPSPHCCHELCKRDAPEYQCFIYNEEHSFCFCEPSCEEYIESPGIDCYVKAIPVVYDPKVVYTKPLTPTPTLTIDDCRIDAYHPHPDQTCGGETTDEAVETDAQSCAFRCLSDCFEFLPSHGSNEKNCYCKRDCVPRPTTDYSPTCYVRVSDAGFATPSQAGH